jgi:hypothetical protein
VPVLSSKAIPAWGLPPLNWPQDSGTLATQLGGQSCAGFAAPESVEFEGDHREKRKDGETDRQKAFFHGSVLPFWFFWMNSSYGPDCALLVSRSSGPEFSPHRRCASLPS